MGELKRIKDEISDESDWYSFGVILPVGLSCLFGLAITFFGFSCRKAICATGFTVLGIVNKLLIINLIIWDKHSTIVGTLGLEEETKLLEMQSNRESSDKAAGDE